MSTASDTDTLVTIFGGSGFLGRYAVRALAGRGYRVRVAARRPDRTNRLQSRDGSGRIEAVQANLRNRDAVAAAVRDSAVVINLVGILFEGEEQRFHLIHNLGAETAARAASAHGARMIHVSAIGADVNSRSNYGRTKALGEKAVLAHAPSATIFRPSIMFGPEDNFFNKFASMARFAPALPLVGGGHTRFQPVFVDDVAEAIAKAVAGEAKPGTIYELGGPDIFTFKELMEFVLATIGRHRLLVPVPFWQAQVLGRFLQLLPSPVLTADQVELLKRDNIVSDAAKREGRMLEALGITARSVVSVVPSYLQRFRETGQFGRHGA
jgi:uncharacterized protein YbjT (DUF2867 family)